MTDNLFTPGNVVVITGAANGIGAAWARRLAKEGLRLSLFDRDSHALLKLADSLNTDTVCVIGDVADEKALQQLYDETRATFGDAQLLINNAGVTASAGPWDSPHAFHANLAINLLSMVALQHLFVPHMLAQQRRCAIINLGSKEGITTPPGNAAYSVAKAGVKVLTEQLAHALRNRVGDRITAHLLVPGFTRTAMNFPGMDEDKDARTAAAWTADQVVDYSMTRLANGDFYILCPDNEVTPLMDKKRIRWASEDITENRPALSRWHPQWQAQFAAWMDDASPSEGDGYYASPSQ